MSTIERKLAPAHVYPIAPPLRSLRYSWDHGINRITMPHDWITFGKKPETKEELEMTKEDIEKQIAELKGKLEEMESGPKFELKPAFGNDSYGCGSSDHVFVSPKKPYIEFALEGVKGDTVCVWLNVPETKSIIQALQKCVDWLESQP